MRRYIDNRPEIGDTLTLRPLITALQKEHPGDEITVRADPHGLLAATGVTIADRCCVVCGETDYEEIETTPYSCCTACGFWYQYPIPTPCWERREVEHHGHLMSDQEKAVNRIIADALVSMYAPKSVFDVGSKYPYLLHCISELGVNRVQGIDGCVDAIEYGESLDVPMVSGNFLQYETDQLYDMVTMIHVLEHFPDPRTALRKVKQILRHDGMLVLRTPYVANDLQASIDLRGGDTSRDLTAEHFKVHPVLFSEKALLRLLEDEGFEISHTTKLDIGQIDIHAKFVEDRQFNPILHQWTGKNPYGNWLRRSQHFYDYPILLAHQSLRWIGFDGSRRLGFDDLPPLVDVTKLRLPDHYVVVAPEVGGASRRWPIERWKKVVAQLRAWDRAVVVVGKTPQHIPDVVDLTGKITVREMISVVVGADLTVSADTSVPHIAAAVRAPNIPVIVLMGPTDASLTFPPKVKVVSRSDGGCIGCHNVVPNGVYTEGEQPPIHQCDWQSPPCMEAIPVGRVLDAISSELAKKDAQPVPLVSVCMMVKNAESQLADALKSIEGFADEVVVVDTGSTDKTKSIARASVDIDKLVLADYDAGDPIRSFSEVRNYAFSLASGRYVMWLDAGDRLTKAHNLRAAIERESADVYQVQTIYGGAFWRARIVRREYAHFVDRVHEALDIDNLRSEEVDAPIEHIWAEKVGREGSLDRNVRLLKMMLKETPNHPNSPRWKFYLARDLMQAGKSDEAVKWYQERVADNNGFWEERAHSLVALVRHHNDHQDFQMGLRYAYDLLKLADGWRDPYYLIGDCYYWMGEYKKALDWYLHCAQISEPTTVLWKWDDLYRWLTFCQLSYCYEKLGNIDMALGYARDEAKFISPGQKARSVERIKTLGQQLEVHSNQVGSQSLVAV